MFSLFKKNPSPSYSIADKVWKTEEAAIKGMLMMAMMRLHNNLPALVITFFESDHQRIAAFMLENQIKFIELTDSSSMDDLSETSIYFANASSLQGSIVPDLLSKNAERFGKEIFFPSHYPISGPEDKALEKLSGLGFSKFIFCLSFDDPLMKMFGSERIIPLMETLGMEENEAIEHPMVSRSIKRARQKLDQKVSKEITAKSKAEWFALNVKP